MANEQNKNTQNQGIQNRDSQNSTSSKTDFGSSATGSDLTDKTDKSISSSGGATGATSARQAKEGTSLTDFGGSDSDASATETAKSAARGIIDQAKNTAGQAYGVATEKAATKIDEQKTTLASGLTSVADTIKQVGGNLREADDPSGITELTAKYGESLANQIEQISNYFDRKDTREMLRDVESFARRNPALFIGGAFTLGLLAARFLKSANRQHSGGTGGRSLTSSNATSRNLSGESFGATDTAGARTNTKPTTNPS